MARLTVRILSRYVLRQHVAPLVFALAALTCFLLIQQVAKQLGNLVGKGLPWSVIIDVFALSLPFIIATTLPMAVLVAVLYAFTRLAGDNEITAMKSGGVSVGSLLVPVLGGAVAIAVLAFAWNDQVLPRANHSLRMLLVDIQRKKPSFSLREQVINEVLPGQFFLRAARIDPAANTLKDVTIYDLGDAERRRIISAANGSMAYDPGGRNLYLTLHDGDIRQVDRTDPAQFNRTFYRTNRIRVVGVGNTLERTEEDNYRSDREMTICEMRWVIKANREDRKQALRDEDVAVGNDLRRLAGLAPLPAPAAAAAASADSSPIGAYCHLLRTMRDWLGVRAAAAQTPARPPAPRIIRAPAPPRPPPRAARDDDSAFLRRSKAQAGQPTSPPLVTAGITASAEARVQATLERQAMYQIEIYKKCALAIACIVFALLGVPIGIRFSRGGVGLVIGVSLIVFTIYYVSLIGGEELGNRRTVSPFVAMWSANILFASVGLVALWLTRRPGHSVSLSGWSDVKDAMGRWMRRRPR